MDKIVIVAIVLFLLVLTHCDVISAQSSRISYINNIATNFVNNELSFEYTRSLRLPLIDMDRIESTVSYDSKTKNYTVSDDVHYFQKQINNIQETNFRNAITSAGFFNFDANLTELAPVQRELTISLDGMTHKVSWSNGTQLPSAFKSLLSVLLSKELLADPCEWACVPEPFRP